MRLRAVLQAAALWFCPRVPRGQVLPRGWSFNEQMVQLRFPLFPFKGRVYQINHDDFAHGWWLYECVVRFERVPGGAGVRVQAFPMPLRVTYEEHRWHS